MFRKVSILYKENDNLAIETAMKVQEWLKNKNVECVLFHSVGAFSSFNHSEIMAIQSSDAVIVLGGDGTMLSASRIINGRKIPIIGINMGTLGFITEIQRTDLWKSLELIFSGSYDIEERSMLNAQVFRDEETINEYLGLNDLVIGKGIMAKISDFELIINNIYVSTIKADGIIISTPTGSTAYNLSAGGPILFPTLKGLVFTPICPHTLSVRPVVLPDNFIIDLVISSNVKDIFLTIDGQIGFPLKINDRVRCRVADEKTYLIAPVGRDYFRVLREKLRWGER
ncbi:MAG TPA: NAD(+)/NADH kinase [Thermodesulfovibrio thiophilus]|uniref:NAD(+)/NADH kinase n=1 Tax=Thermodesulfovibrio thiophilus TaxID=340095 RepID=UPI0017FF2DCA|nr:NAD(+)/NADH kinase [Thermodesulfovibrio thiophilus]HHW20361.1 NAD(+)/NADH kinase [Thermodesulfovibrio thiophilus]HOA82690.1 NAD(+)/NADH kinase [Thermodesulfovibrio thiophilus]HQA03956.1 NAD(+)/NADH kinase [Thermodesulfovibrio thiophilus]HQD35705.1 NAD(+)/NADH kinase [Thermodesulfovibrio thiophilus]